MPPFTWGILLKPLIAIVILVPVRFFVLWLHGRMKDGKLKRLLYRRIS
jgi:hypothetical protein